MCQTATLIPARNRNRITMDFRPSIPGDKDIVAVNRELQFKTAWSGIATLVETAAALRSDYDVR